MEGSGADLVEVREVLEGAADRPGVPLLVAVEGKGEGAGALLAELDGEPRPGAEFFRVEASGRFVELR